MNITQIEGSFPQIPIADKEERKKFIQNWESAPDYFKNLYLEWEPRTQLSIEGAINVCDWNETMHYIDDALGICVFLTSFSGQFGGNQPYHIFNLPTLTSLAVGFDIDSDELWQLAARNRNLVRAINVRRGLRREEEKPPEDHWKKREPETEEKLLDEYYKFKGWTNEGIPTKEKLDELGLDYVAQDFIQRGILSDNDEGSSRESTEEKEKT